MSFKDINPFIPNEKIAKNYTPSRWYSFEDVEQLVGKPISHLNNYKPIDDKWNDFHEYNKEYYKNVTAKDWSGLTSENHLLNALLSGPPHVIPSFSTTIDPETGITYTMMDMPQYKDSPGLNSEQFSVILGSSTNQDILDHQQLEQEFWNGNT